MTSSTPNWGYQQSSSYNELRKQKSDVDEASLQAIDDDEEYRKRKALEAEQLQKAEEQQAQQASQSARKAAEEKTAPNPIQEVGTAVVGAGIDAVEGVGAVLEETLTGQSLNPDFKPTWLQVADEQEPMNRTVWGNLLRGVGEYAVLYGVMGKMSKSAKALKVPGANGLSQALASDKAKTVLGRVTREATKGAIKGAAADYISSYATGETLSTGLNEMFPWAPDWLVTEENDSPIERRLKNVVEGIGLGAVTDVALGWRSASKALKTVPVPSEDALKAFQKTEADLNKVQDLLAQKAEQFRPGEKLTPNDIEFLRQNDPEFGAYEQGRRDLMKQYKEMYNSMSPEAKAASKVVDSADRRQANFNEKVETEFAKDPEGANPNAFVNSPMFDPPDKAVLSPAGKGGMYKSLLESYRMEADGILKNGRRPSVYTESALEQRLGQFNPERRKVIEDVAKQLEKELENASVAPNFEKGITVDKLKALSTAKYIDIVEELGDKPEDLERLRQILMDDSSTQFNYKTGKNEAYLGKASHRAAEMLINTTAGELSDFAQAGRTIDGVMDNSRQVDATLNRMKFLLMETGKAKYIKGFDLNALKADPAEFAKGIAKRETDVANYIDGLKQLFANDPAMVRGYLDVMALADGNVKALDEMYKYAKDQVFNWRSLVGGEGKRSAFIDGLTSTLYNSVLSGPKTIARALMGNGLLTYLRPVQTVIGGVLGGDTKATAMGLATMRTTFEAFGEAWQVAGLAAKAGAQNLEKIPYLANNRLPVTMTDQWKNVGAVIESQGTWADKAMYHVTSTIYDFNNHVAVKYPSIAMSSIDAATSTIMGRVDAKLQAFSKAWDETGGNISKELVDKYDNEFRKQIFDHKAQVIRSDYATRLGDEIGLKIPLEGKVGEVENFINNYPPVRPFFLFMRTGWNALQLVQKHTPILARFNGEVSNVLKATADNLDSVAKYGITNPAQLIEAQATMRGRIAMGYMTVGSAIGLYMSGGLTGNGPANVETKNAWIQTGWKARSIRFGDKWISYDSLEPFTSFLAMTADIGDNSNLLGEAATENWFRKIGYLFAMNVSNKSFVAGLGPLNDVLSMDAARSATWAANVANNQLPWAGARNELANIINPGMRELDTDWRKALQTIVNRNPVARDELPYKYDILDGSVVRDFDPLTRLFNAASPIQINFNDTPTRRLLRESGYDIAFKLSTDSNNNKLDAKTRSRYQNLIGKQNIEGQLEQLFKDPNVINEMKTYKRYRELGIRSATGEGGDKASGMDVQDSYFFSRIDRIFRNAKANAEVQLYQEFPALRSQAINRQVKENLQQSNKPEAALQRILQPPHGK